LVGSAIVRKLREKGYSNLILRPYPGLDLRRQDEAEIFFNEEKPEYVFLAAAKVGGILANNTYKADFIYENLRIAMNVIGAAYKYGTRKLLNLGSSCIYPKFAPQPLKEEYLLSGALEQTNEPYAIAKITAVKLCRFFNEQYRTNFISIMPTNLFGPNDNFNLETAHVLPALMRKFYIANLLSEGSFDKLRDDLKKHPVGFGTKPDFYKADIGTIKSTLKGIGITAENVVVWGTGSPYREFLHVDDLADAAVFLMENYNYDDIGELINIGVGQDRTISEIGLIIKNVVGFKGGIVYDSTKPDGTPRKLLNIEKLRHLKWEHKISLEEGLRRTMHWYEEDN